MLWGIWQCEGKTFLTYTLDGDQWSADAPNEYRHCDDVLAGQTCRTPQGWH